MYGMVMFNVFNSIWGGVNGIGKKNSYVYMFRSRGVGVVVTQEYLSTVRLTPTSKS